MNLKKVEQLIESTHGLERINIRRGVSEILFVLRNMELHFKVHLCCKNVIHFAYSADSFSEDLENSLQAVVFCDIIRLENPKYDELHEHGYLYFAIDKEEPWKMKKVPGGTIEGNGYLIMFGGDIPLRVVCRDFEVHKISTRK